MTCECGCGQQPNPGKRFIFGHQARVRRKPERYRGEHIACPDCGKHTYVREDGRLGVHYRIDSKRTGRYRCPASEQRPSSRPKRRRVTVTLDVILPEGWSIPQFRQEAGRVLRERLDEPHLIGVSVDEPGPVGNGPAVRASNGG